MKRTPLCQLPAAMTVTGRSSSLTNAFITAIIPVIEPTEAEELEALRILGMDPSDIRCAYCGDRSTEWDHLRPIITNQEPTGYITEIANLVPSCGKCNQSKGKSNWRAWITSGARLSPQTRAVPNLDARIARLDEYERWRQPRHAVAGCRGPHAGRDDDPRRPVDRGRAPAGAPRSGVGAAPRPQG